MNQPNVVFVGHVVIDHNKVEQASYESWGSPAMFMTKYLQKKFALDPTVIASYGKDFLAFSDGVKLLPRKPNLDHSTAYENIVIHGHRTQYCHHADNTLPALDSEIKDALSTADLLFLAPLTPAYSVDYVSELMSSVKSGCLKVLLPQGYLRRIGESDLVWPREFDEAAGILPHFDLVVLSDEDHLHASAVAHDWKRLNPKADIIVTRNIEGADIIQEQGVTHVPTNPVPFNQIVDSTGLGDVFSAAVAYNLYQTHDLTSAVQAGHAAAREKLLAPKTI